MLCHDNDNNEIGSLHGRFLDVRFPQGLGAQGGRPGPGRPPAPRGRRALLGENRPPAAGFDWGGGRPF